MKPNRVPLSFFMAALSGTALALLPGGIRQAAAADFGPEPAQYWNAPEQSHSNDWGSYGWSREMALLESGSSTTSEVEETSQVEEASSQDDEYRYEYAYEYAYPEQRYGNNETQNENDQEEDSKDDNSQDENSQPASDGMDETRDEEEYSHDEDGEYSYDDYTYDGYADDQSAYNPDDYDYEAYDDSESDARNQEYGYSESNEDYDYGEDYDYEDSYASEDEWNEEGTYDADVTSDEEAYDEDSWRDYDAEYDAAYTSEYEDEYPYEDEGGYGYDDEYGHEDEYGHYYEEEYGYGYEDESPNQSTATPNEEEEEQTDALEDEAEETNESAEAEAYWYYDEADYGVVDADEDVESLSDYPEEAYFDNAASDAESHDYADTYEYYGKNYYKDEYGEYNHGWDSSSSQDEPRVELLGSSPEDLLTTADQNLLRALVRSNEAPSGVARATFNDYLGTLGMEATDFQTRFETASDMEVLSLVDDVAAAAAFLGAFRLVEQGELSLDEAVETLRQNLHGLPEAWILGVSAITTQTEGATTSLGRPVIDAFLSVAAESLDQLGNTCQTLSRKLTALRGTKTAEAQGKNTMR